MVSKPTTNDERPGNDAMGVQGKRADAEGFLADGGSFGNQVEQLELTPVPDVGDLLKVSFFPGLGGLAGAVSVIGYRCKTLTWMTLS